MWTIDVVTETRGFEGLRGDWSRLADLCPTSTVFQTFEWLYSWWRDLGSRNSSRTLYIVTVRDAKGELVGLAPLVTSPWRVAPFLRRLSFLGAGVTDYHDFLALPDLGGLVCDEIYKFLASSRSWHICDFAQLRDGSLLRDHPPARDSRLASVDFILERCPYLPFPEAADTETPGDADRVWQAITKQYSKKMRSHIGYYERKLKALYEVEISTVKEMDEIDEAMDALYELHSRRWNKRWQPGVLGSAAIQKFHRRIAREFLGRDWLRLHYILLDKEYQALLYCFTFKDRTCYYQGGFEPTLARLSLGSVLTARAIRLAVEEGRTQFDFLRGDEPYKERWTQDNARVNMRRLVARAGSWNLAIARLECRIENSIEMRLKDFMHHVYSKEPRQSQSTNTTEGEKDI